MKRAEDLTQARLKEVLEYSPETGKFFRRVSRGPSKAGDEAGSPSNKGRYTAIVVDYQRYRAHRLVWLYVYGEWPPEDMEVDHINRNGLDNRTCNLRLLTHSQNNHNTDSHGAYLKDNRWVAKICIRYKQIHLGYYSTEKEARDAYLRAKRAVTEEGNC